MGAWGLGSFENDDALDWVYELEGSDDLTLLQGTLSAVTGAAGSYLDAYVCCRALAAAEVVAALNGHPAPGLPEEVTSWMAGRPSPPPDLTATAREAVRAVRQGSELLELWEETDELPAWLVAVQDLDSRLT